MKLSIIIPVYNVRDYLSLCINSIIGQNVPDIEIILIDDGSTDGSGAVCETFANSYSYIKLITQKNGGVSHARNVGIENARGEYLMFVDSDDTLVKKSLSQALDCVRQYGVDLGIFRSCDSEGKNKRVEFAGFPNSVVNRKINGRKCFNEVGYRSVVWSAIYKTSFIQSHLLRFKENMANGEDSLFMNYLYMKDPVICFYNINLYSVTARDGSASRNWTYPRLKMMAESISKIVNDLNDADIDSFERSVIEFSICRQISNIYDHVGTNISLGEVLLITKDINKRVSHLKLRPEDINVHKMQCKLINTSVYLFAAIKLLISFYRRFKMK